MTLTMPVQVGYASMGCVRIKPWRPTNCVIGRVSVKVVRVVLQWLTQILLQSAVRVVTQPLTTDGNSSANCVEACLQEHIAVLVISCALVGYASMKTVPKKHWTTMQSV